MCEFWHILNTHIKTRGLLLVSAHIPLNINIPLCINYKMSFVHMLKPCQVLALICRAPMSSPLWNCKVSCINAASTGKWLTYKPEEDKWGGGHLKHCSLFLFITAPTPVCVCVCVFRKLIFLMCERIQNCKFILWLLQKRFCKTWPGCLKTGTNVWQLVGNIKSFQLQRTLLGFWILQSCAMW